MASFNKILLIGNLTRDPELRYTPGGQAVSTLRLAVTHNYKAASGELKKETAFLDVVVWAKLAENCSRYLKKGSPIFVEGRLRLREYDAKDGTKRRVTEVVANNVQFLERAPRDTQAEAPAEAPGGSEAALGEPAEEPLQSFTDEEAS